MGGQKIVAIMAVHFRYRRGHIFLLGFENCLWNKHLVHKKVLTETRATIVGTHRETEIQIEEEL